MMRRFIGLFCITAWALIALLTVGLSPEPVGAQAGINILRINSATVDIGNGTAGPGTLRVAIASNNTAFGVNLAQYTPVSGRLPVDGSGVTQPVSQSSTPWLVRPHDGTLGATVRDTGANDSLNVAIVDASGGHITTFGGGVQYTEADVDSTITGTAAMWEDGGNTLRSVSAATPFPVNVVAGGGSGGTSSNFGSAFPGPGTAVGFNDGTNMQGARVVDADTGAGTAYALVMNLVRRASGGPVELVGQTTMANSLPIAIASDQSGVPISSLTPGTGASNLGKAEDAAHASGDVGSLVFGVRNDAGGALAGTNGDYIPFTTDANGALYVNPGPLTAAADSIQLGEGAVLVDVLDLTNSNPLTVAMVNGSGDQITSFGGGTEYTVNAAAPADPVGATFVMERDDALSTLTEVEGDWTQPRSSATGALWVSVDGTVTVGSHNVTNAGTFVVQENGAALTALQLIDNIVSGAGVNITQWGGTNVVNAGIAGTLAVGGLVAHDAGAGSVNPILAGFFAVNHSADPTAVAASDLVRAIANRDGIPFTMAGHPNVVTLEAAYTAAQTDTAIVTVSAGTQIIVTEVDVVADNANTVDVGYRVGFGTVNTPTTTGVVTSHPGLAAGTGVIRGTGSGILGIGADGADLRITSEVPTSGSIRVVVTYYLVES